MRPTKVPYMKGAFVSEGKGESTEGTHATALARSIGHVCKRTRPRWGEREEPTEGIEPPTGALQEHCYTAKPRWHMGERD